MSLNVFEDYINKCIKDGIEPSWQGLRAYRKLKKKSNPYAQNKKLIIGTINNEVKHIKENLELDFTKNNLDYKQAESITDDIYKTLVRSLDKDQRILLDELRSSIGSEYMELCKFYFKEGLKAGLNNLSYLNEIDDVEYII